jgi:hypothetical protein
MIERTIFECEHCHKKRLMNKSQMKNHEEICWYNPKNKSCLTCSNYTYEPAYLEPHPELDGCPSENIPALRYCDSIGDLPEQPFTNCEGWILKEV